MKNFLSSLKGKIIAGVGTLAVIAAAIAIGVSLNIGYRTICVDNFTGVTKVTAHETVSEVFKGQNLQSGNSVAVGENADLTLALDTDKHVYAKELTRFQLEALGKAGKDSKTVIKLEKGCVLNRIDGKLQENESYTVESPNAVMAVRGTTFTVTVFYDEDGVCHTVVEVEEGTVEVYERDENGNLTGEVQAVGAGESIEIIDEELLAENEPETTTETTVTTIVTAEETTTVSAETEVPAPEFADEEELEAVTDATTTTASVTTTASSVTTTSVTTTTAPVTTTTVTTTAAVKEEFITIKGEKYSTLLTTLDLNSKNLTNEDIKPLKKMVNLESLNLNGNQISDISPLSGLTNLKHLNLINNQISDISALSGLTNLISLDLNHNQISDISLLSGLTKLKGLILDDNQISDISALSGLTKLEDLHLNYNQISDISALSGLTNLKMLHLEDNQISDISALSGLTNLITLDLNHNQISDISALSELYDLAILNLEFNPINDISALKGLTKLEHLDLKYSHIGKKSIADLKKALPECRIIS